MLLKNDSDAAALQDEQYKVRVEKVEKMQAMGINPWPTFKPVNATSKQVLGEFSDEKESRTYEVAGRILTSRMHGKAGFMTIQDEGGNIQLYIREDMVGDQQFAFLQNFIDLVILSGAKGNRFVPKRVKLPLK